MKRKRIFAKFISLLLSAVMVFTSTDFTVFAEGSSDSYVEDAYSISDNPFEYALFAADKDNSLCINAGSFVVNGHVHTNNVFSYQGEAIAINGTLESAKQVSISVSDENYAEKIGKISEAISTIEMSDITDEIYEEISDNAVIHNEYASYSQTVVDKHTIVNGSAGIFSSTFSGDCVFMATGDIQFGVDTLSSIDGGKLFLGSQYGNISIYASDTQMDGILYAPNGTVTITGSNVQINGRIIAKNIAFYGSNLAINASENDLEILDCLTPDREPDLLPDLTPDIQGPLDGRENRKIQFTMQENPDSSKWTAEGITWEVYGITGEQKTLLVKDVDYIFQASEDGKTVEMVFSKAGAYQIATNVVYNNKTFSGISDLSIATDSAPVAAIKVKECFLRDASGSVEVTIEDESYSPDGDTLGNRVYRIFYDENKDGAYQDMELLYETESPETNLVYPAEKAGDYKVVLVARDAAGSDVADESLLKAAEAEAYFEVKDREPEITANLRVSPAYEYVLLTDSQNEQNQQFAEALEAYRSKFADADNSYNYTAQMYTSEAFTEYSGHKYQVVDISTTWEGANAICRKMGGHMATIQSQEENDALFNYVKEQGYESAYFGLSDLEQEGAWTWRNGEEVTYTNWQNGEPNGNRLENYAMFYAPFKVSTWNDGSFNYGHTMDDVSVFICEWDENNMQATDAEGFPEDVFTKQGSHRVIFTDIYESGQSEETIARWEAAMLETGAEIVRISSSEDITKELDKNLAENSDGNEKYYVGDELVCDYSIDTAQEELTYHYTTEYETLQGADKETAVSDTLPALQQSGKYAISVAVTRENQQIAHISLVDGLCVFERPGCSVDVKVTRRASEPGVVNAEVVTESISGENLTYEYAYKKFGDAAFTQGALPEKLDSNAYYILTVIATDEWGVESYPGVAFISTCEEDVELTGPTFDIELSGNAQIRPRYEYAIIGESGSDFMTSAEAVMGEYAISFETADAAFFYELLHGWEDVKAYNGHYYWILPVKATWPNARIICENMGGHLVTISSEEENQFVLQYAKEMGRAGYVAMGLNDLEKEGTWEWITGEEVVYTNWHSGEPNNGLGGTQQDYAFMYDDAKGTWDDGYVNNTTRYFMCEWESREAYESALIVELNRVFTGDGSNRTVILEQSDSLSDKTAALLEANILSTGAELYVAEDVTQVQSILEAHYESIETQLKEKCFVGDEILLSGNYEELDETAGYTWQYVTGYKAFGSEEAENSYSAEIPALDKAGIYSISVEAVYTEGEESAACELVLVDELIVYERPKFEVDVTLHRSASNQAEVSAEINTESISGEIISYDCAYKKYGDAEFTAGSLPEQLDLNSYYLLKLTATDVHGIKSHPVVKLISTYEADIPDVSAPEIKISFSQNPVTVNTEVSLFFAVADVSEIGEQKFYINGEEVLPDNGIYTFVPTETGDYEIKVDATDSKGNQGTAVSVLQVQEQTNADTTSPTAFLTDIVKDGENSNILHIYGNVDDETEFTRYVLVYRQEGVETATHTILESRERPESELLGDFDISELESGTYTIILTAWDAAENFSQALMRVTIDKTTDSEVSKSESGEQTISWGTIGWNEDRTAVVIEAESSYETGLAFVGHASDDGREIPVTTVRQENHYTITIPVSELETGKYIVYARTEETLENISALLFEYDGAEGDDSLSADTGVLKATITEVVLDNAAGVILVKGTIEATAELATREITCTEAESNTTVQVNTDSTAEGVLAEIPLAGLESGDYCVKLSVSDAEGRVATAGYSFTYVKGSTPEIEVDKEDKDDEEDEGTTTPEEDKVLYVYPSEYDTALGDYKQKAKQLGNWMAVYTYVRNNTRYEYYSGVRKSAEEVYDSYGGNAADQAVLLSEMLKELGYEVRLVEGRIRITCEQAMHFTDADSVEAAAAILQMCDSNATVYYNAGGAPQYVELMHTWIEALVPTAEYGMQGEENLWVALDTCFKSYRENKTFFDELEEAGLLTLKQEEMLDAYTKDSLEEYTDRWYNSIQNHTFASDSVYLNQRSIARLTELRKSDLISFEIRERIREFDGYSAGDYDYISFSLDYLELGKISSYDLYNSRLFLRYEQLTGGYMQAVLSLNGEIIGRGPEVPSGMEQTLTMEVHSNGKRDTIRDTIKAGSFYSIVTDAQTITGRELTDAFARVQTAAETVEDADIYTETYLGALLDYAGKLYFAQTDISNTLLAEQENMLYSRTLSVALLAYEKGESGDMLYIDVDLDGRVVAPKTSDLEGIKRFSLASGMVSSMYESILWEQVTGEPAVSTITAFDAALLADSEMLYLTGDNWAEKKALLNVSAEVYSDIESAILSGKMVIVPADEVSILDWTGSGYVILSMEDYSGTYRITGGLNGGMGVAAVNTAYLLNGFVTAVDMAQMVTMMIELLPLIMYGGPVAKVVALCGAVMLITLYVASICYLNENIRLMQEYYAGNEAAGEELELQTVMNVTFCLAFSVGTNVASKTTANYLIKTIGREVGEDACAKLVSGLGARKGLKLINLLKKSGMGVDDIAKLVLNVSDDGLKTLFACASGKMPAEMLLYLCKHYNLLDNYTDDVLQMLGDSSYLPGVVYGMLEKYGDDFIHFYQRHGDDAIEVLSKHGDELYALPESYRMEAIDLVMSYGDEILEGIRKHGDDFMARYANEGETFIQEYLMKGDEVFNGSTVPEGGTTPDGDSTPNTVPDYTPYTYEMRKYIIPPEDGHQAYLEREYIKIREQGFDDIVTIANNTGISQEELYKLKKHVFLDTHMLSVDGAPLEQLYFQADSEIAYAWKQAMEGELSEAEKEWFQQLLNHELTESLYMEQGLPLRDPSTYIDGRFVTDPIKNAHDKANLTAPQPNAYPGHEYLEEYMKYIDDEIIY